MLRFQLFYAKQHVPHVQPLHELLQLHLLQQHDGLPPVLHVSYPGLITN